MQFYDEPIVVQITMPDLLDGTACMIFEEKNWEALSEAYDAEYTYVFDDVCDDEYELHLLPLVENAKVIDDLSPEMFDLCEELESHLVFDRICNQPFDTEDVLIHLQGSVRNLLIKFQDDGDVLRIFGSGAGINKVVATVYDAMIHVDAWYAPVNSSTQEETVEGAQKNEESSHLNGDVIHHRVRWSLGGVLQDEPIEFTGEDLTPLRDLLEALQEVEEESLPEPSRHDSIGTALNEVDAMSDDFLSRLEMSQSREESETSSIGDVQ